MVKLRVPARAGRKNKEATSSASRWKQSGACEDCPLLKSLSSLWIFTPFSVDLHLIGCSPTLGSVSVSSLSSFLRHRHRVNTATRSWFRLEVKWFCMTSRKRCQVEQPPSNVRHLFVPVLLWLSTPSIFYSLRYSLHPSPLATRTLLISFPPASR